VLADLHEVAQLSANGSSMEGRGGTAVRWRVAGYWRGGAGRGGRLLERSSRKEEMGI
jgi:hypothetical protein